ncbi:cation diffusion zinc membrane transporter Zrg17 [Sporothrix curviconia]|uniref:Zinc transporter n=1 Tax=Sporothrix curviconia TaxID=1260050 RepID=A0ABP0C3H5_9PEZI
MASGPEPPSISVSLSPPHDSPVAAATHSSQPRPRPPSILLEPTSDGEGDGGLGVKPLGAAGVDDPFRFEVDNDDSSDFYDGQPLNAHAAALLRRSPSPVLDFASPPPAASRLLSSSPGTHLLSPDAHLHGTRSFLHPDAAMDDLSSSPVNSAPISIGGSSPAGNPFNFQTQYISTSPVKSNIGLRRGHRYKHSSVSAQHQIFQEPPPRPPPVLPASLPVPTVREAWASMHRDQRARLYWCLCHAAVAVFVFLCATEGGDSLALTALSHLVFFDVGSAAVCVAVDVLGNFEVWRRSTIRHPFGLRRAEVLAGFAMSIFLVFGGFDLLSHDLKDCLEAATSSAAAVAPGAAHAHHAHAREALVDAAGHSMAAAAAAAAADAGAGASSGAPHMDIGGHSGHHHTRYIHPGTVDVAALAAFASTLVSAYGLGNDARIRRALLMLHGVAPYPRNGNGGFIASCLAWLSSAAGFLSSLGLSSLLANPFHFLTMAVSLVLLVLPLMFVAVQAWLDRLLCAMIAVSMLLLGSRLAVAQGLMLLMSYSGKEGGGASGSAGASFSHKSQSPSLSQKNQPPLHLPSSSTSTPATVALEKKAPTVASVLDEIAAEPQIARVEDAQFWQVHYGLGMANLRVRIAQGCNDDATLRQVRSRIARVVQSRLGEGYGMGNSLRWEVTVQTSVDG